MNIYFNKFFTVQFVIENYLQIRQLLPGHFCGNKHAHYFISPLKYSDTKHFRCIQTVTKLHICIECVVKICHSLFQNKLKICTFTTTKIVTSNYNSKAENECVHLYSNIYLYYNTANAQVYCAERALEHCSHG